MVVHWLMAIKTHRSTTGKNHWQKPLASLSHPMLFPLSKPAPLLVVFAIEAIHEELLLFNLMMSLSDLLFLGWTVTGKMDQWDNKQTFFQPKKGNNKSRKHSKLGE